MSTINQSEFDVNYLNKSVNLGRKENAFDTTTYKELQGCHAPGKWEKAENWNHEPTKIQEKSLNI